MIGQTLLDHFLKTGDREFLIDRLVGLHKKILQPVSEEFISYKTFLQNSILEDRTDHIQKIKQLPDGNYLCHGDFHPDNIIIDQKGKCFIIDFMNVCLGPWQYDVARTYFLLKYGEVDSHEFSKSDIKKSQSKLAELYLEKMDVRFSNIAQYIAIIKEARKYELIKKRNLPPSFKKFQ